MQAIPRIASLSWRGSLLPLGCEAAPNRAIDMCQIQFVNRSGSASHSSGSKLPRHTNSLLQRACQ
ncbi:hypothetical protein C9383_20160 [Pseudomonas palleroniana]|uniref:Uncharacterized protein n=1 Tax=Pseudomonas palleroniana TaxID=191390 RepID=A0A2T4FIE9_9PSED|nr:hypothetical protein F7R03_09665 [Pseudomonas palleroniana]PTC23179.1 hypothetical protein C9383_20160 [Pseudomonas palleroniana]